LSCGTGVTAAAIAYAFRSRLTGQQTIEIRTLGGNLSVSFERNENKFTNVYLEGPAIAVFKGEIHV
jgi:diaminopimelate epimerase